MDINDNPDFNDKDYVPEKPIDLNEPLDPAEVLSDIRQQKRVARINRRHKQYMEEARDPN